MWAAHDDQWKPSFITECVAKIESNPSAILCFVQHLAFDDRTGTTTPVNYPMDLQNPVIWQRLYALLMCWPLPNVIVYGLYRTELLKKADSIVFGSGAPDTLVLLKALLFGTFVMVDSPLHTYTISQRDIKQRIKQMQFQGKHITLILLSTDFKLFRTLIQIIKQATPELRFRLLLLKSAIIFMYRVAGWPISLRLITRYLFPLLPDNWSNKVKLLLKR
jgi:hypothetical protein